MDEEAIEMRYLLGKLSEDEAARLEQSSFADDRVFDQIEIAEDELIDAYTRGSLSSEDRKRFQQKLSSSERLAERVEFAKLLSKSASSRLVGNQLDKARWWDRLFDFSFIQSPALRGAVTAGVFLVVFGIPASVSWIRLRNESRRLSEERAAIAQQKLQLADQQTKINKQIAELQNAKEPENESRRQEQIIKEQLPGTNERPTALASKLLLPLSLRSTGETELLNVPSTASSIELLLVLDNDDYTSYQATIRSTDNREILTRPRLKPRRSGKDRIIILQFPSRLLSSGEYDVRVSGRASSGSYEYVANYTLHVSKKKK